MKWFVAIEAASLGLRTELLLVFGLERGEHHEPVTACQRIYTSEQDTLYSSSTVRVPKIWR